MPVSPQLVIISILGFMLWAGILAFISRYLLQRQLQLYIAPLMLVVVVLTYAALTLPRYFLHKQS